MTKNYSLAKNSSNMNKIKFIAILLPLSCWGQSTDQYVISSSGNHYSNGNIQMSYTIGESVTATLAGASNKLTQGFHQPIWEVLGIEDYTPFSTVTVYPNPLDKQLTIETNFHEIASYELVDFSGKLIRKGILEKQITTVETSDLTPSEYLLNVIDAEQTIISTFKLIKIK